MVWWFLSKYVWYVIVPTHTADKTSVTMNTTRKKISCTHQTRVNSEHENSVEESARSFAECE